MARVLRLQIAEGQIGAAGGNDGDACFLLQSLLWRAQRSQF